jgi:hypothetical protein
MEVDVWTHVGRGNHYHLLPMETNREMTYLVAISVKDKAQELVQKHTKYAYVQRLRYSGGPIEETRKQNAIEAALITARECGDAAVKAAGQAHVNVAMFWTEVIAELESMKNQ